MKVFALYTKSEEIKSFKEIIAVQHSFNSWAMLFGMWWALFNRQFYLAALLFLVMALVSRLYDMALINAWTQLLLLGYISIVLGIEAGAIVESRLRQQSYIYHGLVMAESATAAKYQYLNH